VATRKRAPSRTTGTRTTRATRRKASGPSWYSRISPDVVRSIVGLTLLVVGAMTLIALVLPGEGSLTSWWTDVFAPWFGTMRWLLPFFLLAAGWWLEWGPGRRQGSGWGLTLLGLAIAYVGFVGAAEVLGISGGRVGRALAGFLGDLVTDPGAFIVLMAMGIGGLLLGFGLQLKQLLRPVTATATFIGGTAAEALRREPTAGMPATAKTGNGTAAADKSTRKRDDPAVVPVGPGVLAAEVAATRSILDEPAPRVGQSPLSQTVWTGPGDGGSTGTPRRLATEASAKATNELRDGTGSRAAAATAELPTALESLQAIDWNLPSIELLEPRVAGRLGATVDHESNKRRIEEKLLSFSIPAKVVSVNSGPVVTQYEVRPEHHVKVSRIEALADDLAMALAARSIRIEAPIPGKDVVGIEIPNSVSEVVGFKPLVDESQMLDSTSPLTFALGRDVSGKAYAVDLAKMPHLLVAGATGSGKSVCVNALITSVLMRARPDEVRMVLVDLKRVELAPYNGLPHLLQHVIVEPAEAKAVLNWAVREMEERYKLLAAHNVRNIAAFNARPEALAGDDGSDAVAERMPYIVLIIDELADLIMREGRKVEDPIVKIAQKARAVGIHLVLATQRPSVNVVTGLIKANVPSRIAFAMASMVDSRTVLDAPGAEDLIGRGDMLYQPVDLPRPLRMQGVFVSDREVSAVTKHWLDQTGGRTFYDEGILEFADPEDGGSGGDGGQFAWLRKLGVDEMTVPAAELVTSAQRASTSMLQTKLKLGFARASRVMDELERYGIIGPQDPRNPAALRQIYGPENWFTSQADIDDDGD
jgi:S-DNA-T family DNA segregation ATPase FtsK/SpoIIIE